LLAIFGFILLVNIFGFISFVNKKPPLARESQGRLSSVTTTLSQVYLVFHGLQITSKSLRVLPAHHANYTLVDQHKIILIYICILVNHISQKIVHKYEQKI